MSKTDALANTGGVNPQTLETEVNNPEKMDGSPPLKPNLSIEQQDWLNRVFIPNFRSELQRTFKTGRELTEAEQRELEDFRRRSQELEERELKSKGNIDALLQKHQQSFREEVTDLKSKNRRLTRKLAAVKIEQALLNEASKRNVINPTQVMKLLRDEVELGESDEVIVIDEHGHRKMNEDGGFVRVEDAVKDFLQDNPHLVRPGRGSNGGGGSQAGLRPGRVMLEPITGGELIAEGLAEDRHRTKILRKQQQS